MRVEKYINISNIKVDKFSLSKETLGIIDYIRSGGEVPPIKVYKKDGVYVLKEGRHRITAHKLLGLTKIKCKLYEVKRVH